MDSLELEAMSQHLALLDRVGRATESVARAIEHHQVSLQSVWEMLDSIESGIKHLAEIAERYDTRDEEQFQWRVEARRRDSRPALEAAAEAIRSGKLGRA